MSNYALMWKKRTNLQAYTFDDFVSSFPSISKSFFLAKIDGQLAPILFQKGKKTFFQTTSNHVVDDLPVIDEYEKLFNKLNLDQAIFVGELVAKQGDKILPFNQQQSIIKKSYLPANKNKIYHYLFDIYFVNNKEITSFSTSYNMIKSLETQIKKFNYIDIVPYSQGDMKEFRSFFNNVINISGVEGAVIRTDGKNYKIKIPESFDVVILGAGNTKMKLWPRRQISYLIVGFVDKNNILRLSSKIGTGFTSSLREELYQYVMKNKVLETEDGDAFVPPEKVIEVNCRGYFFKEMPTCEYKNGQYYFKGKKLSATLRQPSFIRFREDKTVNDYDVRISQVHDFPLNESQIRNISDRIIGYWRENSD